MAVGVTQAARSTYATSGLGLWRSVSGTSYSTPQVAGAGALLMGAGITDPMAIRALLIDSARNGRATPADPMGTQVGWQPDWGWGELDLTQAYAEHLNLRAGTVRPEQPRFFAAATQSAGDRATLVWNRRATTSLTNLVPQDWLTTTSALTNLDLVERSAAGCAARTSSASTVDNVEQTRSPSAGNVIYVVRSKSDSIDGRDDEPFAFASTRAATALTTPVPKLDVTLAPARLAGGDIATLTVKASNLSPDMTASDLAVTPQLPAGFEIVDGPATQTSAAFPTSATREFTWKLRVSGDGPRSVAVRASDVACGETIAARASASIVVDSSGPVSTIDVPAAHAGDTAVRWSATDSSGVASYDLEASTDGAAFQPWLTATNVAAATYAAAPGHSYAFRVRARDVFGQLGDWATSAALAVAAPTQPAPPKPAAQQLLSPSLRIASVARSKTRTRLTVRGTIASSARSAVHLRVRLRSGRRSRTLAATAVPRAGRWSATLRFPRSLARPRSAEVSARYDADFTLASGIARRSLRLR